MAKKRDIYEVDGQRVPGVTSVIGVLDKSGPLMHWAVREAITHIEGRWQSGRTYAKEQIDLILQDAKVAHRVRKETAGDIGSNIHEIVESYIEGQLKPEDIQDDNEHRALKNFITITEGWEWLGSEIVVINDELLYGGTADGIARLPDGTIVVADVKTSKGVYPEYSLQLAMYAMATPKSEDKKLRDLWNQIREGRILHFNKERLTWEVLERDIEKHKEYIPHLRQVYDWQWRFRE